MPEWPRATPAKVGLDEALLARARDYALAGGGSYITSALSQHTSTNIEVVRMFLDVRIDAHEVRPHEWLIAISAM